MKWRGRICQRIHLSNFGFAVEKRWLKENGHEALIAPYMRFSESKVPVVIIHGYGPAFLIRPLVLRLHRCSRQVMIVFYNNMDTAPHENGRQIAQALINMRDRHYRVGQPLDLLAHSMGGIVGRCALNYMQDPGWLGDPRAVMTREIGGGYGPIRFRTADTGIDGYGESSNDDDLNDVVEESKESPLAEMYADSPMFRKLYSVDLPNVDFQNTAAYRRKNKDIDYANSFPELSPESARLVVVAVVNGSEPQEPQLRNLVRGLRADSRYDTLCQAIRMAVANQRISLVQTPTADFLKAVTGIYDRIMPRVRGKHIWLLRDTRLRKDEIVDRWLRELARPPARGAA